MAVFLGLIWIVVGPVFQRNGRHAGSKEYAFFHTQSGHYAACLLAGNLFTSSAGLAIGSWVAAGGLHNGKYVTSYYI